MSGLPEGRGHDDEDAPMDELVAAFDKMVKRQSKGSREHKAGDSE